MKLFKGSVKTSYVLGAPWDSSLRTMSLMFEIRTGYTKCSTNKKDDDVDWSHVILMLDITSLYQIRYLKKYQDVTYLHTGGFSSSMKSCDSR